MDDFRFVKVFLAWLGSAVRTSYITRTRKDHDLDHVKAVWSRTYPAAVDIEVRELTDEEAERLKDMKKPMMPSYVSMWG